MPINFDILKAKLYKIANAHVPDEVFESMRANHPSNTGYGGGGDAEGLKQTTDWTARYKPVWDHMDKCPSCKNQYLNTSPHGYKVKANYLLGRPAGVGDSCNGCDALVGENKLNQHGYCANCVKEQEAVPENKGVKIPQVEKPSF